MNCGDLANRIERETDRLQVLVERLDEKAMDGPVTSRDRKGLTAAAARLLALARVKDGGGR